MVIKNKKILITGGLGFVGSHLANYLSKLNKVFVLDNLFTGKLKNKSVDIIFIKDECVNINKIKKIKNIKIDFIFHLGEYSRVEQSYDDIDKVIELNIRPFYEVVKFAKNNKSKIIYSGSSTIHGRYKTKTDISPYTWSKKVNIDFLNQYAKWFKVNYAIAYFYNVYGENEIQNGKYATVIAKFIKLKKLNEKKLPITYPGTQKRNFTHVEDIVSGLEIVALYGEGDEYGIGSDKSYSIIDLANLLNMDYKITKEKKGNRLFGKLKTSKIKKLGWKASNNLEQYIKSKLHY